MTALEAWKLRPTVIRFGCSIRLPGQGNFQFRDMFEADPQGFIADWLEGAIGSIYRGPLHNQFDDHDGHILVIPKVVVRYHPNVPNI